MGLYTIIGLFILGLLCTLFFILLRAFIIYSICKDLPEKEQEEFLKELEKREEEAFYKNKDII